MRNEPGAGKRPLKHETGAEPAAEAARQIPRSGTRRVRSRDGGASTLDVVKGRTDKESNDPATDAQADDASRPGKRKCRRGEKHRGSQARFVAPASSRRRAAGPRFTRGQKPRV